VKVVLDTNVMVSGLMRPNSIPGRIVAAWRNAHFHLVLSETTLLIFRSLEIYDGFVGAPVILPTQC
jgi:predicted nucleic acid-binding protein